MSEKRTKADKAQREADQLEKKSFHRPAQNQGKKAREDFSQAAVRIVEEVLSKSELHLRRSTIFHGLAPPSCEIGHKAKAHPFITSVLKTVYPRF